MKVFPFGLSIFFEINVGEKETVLNVIEKIIQKYLSDPKTNKMLLINLDPKAYELRYPDEDEACKPDLTLEPLNENQEFFEYFLDSVVYY